MMRRTYASRVRGSLLAITQYAAEGAVTAFTADTGLQNKENLMAKGQSLQDPFLNALRKERIPVSIYLVNGIKLQGQIDSFDQFVVLLKNSVSQMVYKHAISTVVPARNVRVPSADEAGAPAEPQAE